MATQTPDAVRAENAHAPLRWLSLAEARDLTSEPNLIQTLARMERLGTHLSRIWPATELAPG